MTNKNFNLMEMVDDELTHQIKNNLTPHLDDIKNLISSGTSIKTIHDALNKGGVGISYTYLCTFLRVCGVTKNTKRNRKKEAVISKPKVEIAQQIKSPTDEVIGQDVTSGNYIDEIIARNRQRIDSDLSGLDPIELSIAEQKKNGQFVRTEIKKEDLS